MSATNRGSIREPRDFYATPLTVFVPLLPYIKEAACSGSDVVYEPACGDGRLVIAMRNAGLKSEGADIANGFDFLKDDACRDCIVTNPPYSLALEFCRHAINHAPHVFMLLRISFLGAQKRRYWWRVNEPRALFVVSKRLSFVKGGTDNCEYAWFYWGRTHSGIYHL